MWPSRASLTVAGTVPRRKPCVLAGTAKGCSCPVYAPVLTLLSPHKGDRVSNARVTVLLNIKWCPPHSAKDSTESSPSAAPGPQIQCVHMPFQSKNIWWHSARSPRLEVLGGEGWPRQVVLLVGRDMVASSLFRTVHCSRSDVQGR